MGCLFKASVRVGGAFSYFVYIIHMYSVCMMPFLTYYTECSSKDDAKQKHLGCKKERGQSEATLHTGRRDQKV